LVPFVSLVTWRLHSAVHSGTQRALIARFMSRANTCTHTNAHAHTHERCLSLPLSPPCRCHAHARTCGPPWRGHAHLLVLSHSCTASSQVPIQPRAPSSLGRWTHGQAGTALPPAAFPSPCTPGTTRRDAACPRAGSRVASRPHARMDTWIGRPPAPSTLCRAAHPGRAPTARSSPRLRGCSAKAQAPYATSALRDRARPLAFMLARKRGPRIAERRLLPYNFSLAVTKRKKFGIFFYAEKTDSPWALL
jgi:hypothetical protein